MSTTGIVFFTCLMALPFIAALLIDKSTRENAEKLTRIGLVAEAEVVSIFASDDAIVKFKFLLPDNKTIMNCTYALPIRYMKLLRAGDRIAVRYNPKCPAINSLEPDTPLPEAGSATFSQ
jgi:hypothetical protein